MRIINIKSVKALRFTFLPVIYVSAIEQLEAAENHQTSENDKPQLGREQERADRADPDDQQDQPEQFDFSGFPAAYFFIVFKKRQRNHFLRLGRQQYTFLRY
jgi:hypothetical protein